MNLNYWLYRSWIKISSSPEKQPIIILGNQKTGTSAIASLLGEATNKTYCIDIFCHLGDLQKKLFEDEMKFGEFVKNSKDFFSKKIIKEPSLTFFYSELKSIFPAAKFCLIIRDPYENIRSICNRLNIPGNCNSKFESKHYSNLSDDWKYILEGSKYGHKGNTIIETLAKRVNSCYEIYLKNSSNITLLKYEDFLQDKKGFIDSLGYELGFQIKENIKDKLNIQFQPKGQNIRSSEFFSEENYNAISRECILIIKDQYPII